MPAFSLVCQLHKLVVLELTMLCVIYNHLHMYFACISDVFEIITVTKYIHYQFVNERVSVQVQHV